jgi:hypothetical protein
MMDILFEWMAEVCIKFKFQSETFFLSVNLVYRYLSFHQVTRDRLQLLGATSLFMAGKYEEIYPPQLKDYLPLCENAFTKVDLLAVETKMLAAVDFKLAVPSALKFLHRYSHVAGLAKKEHHFACLVLELATVTSRIALLHKNSLLAAASVYLAIKVFSKSPEWPLKLAEAAKLKLAEVQPCAKEVFLLVFRLFGHPHDEKGTRFEPDPAELGYQAIKRKYAGPELSEVSRMRFEWRAGLQQT